VPFGVIHNLTRKRVPRLPDRPPQHLGDTPALAEQPVTLEEGQQAQVSLTLPAHG
jgi:hypothetical protein